MDGDARCHSVAAAAVLAKTVRDLLMQRLAPRYPGYGWQTNVGYGTAEHQESLRLHGPTRHHRYTFAPDRAARTGAVVHCNEFTTKARRTRRARSEGNNSYVFLDVLCVLRAFVVNHR